jgi:hypothetical protein
MGELDRAKIELDEACKCDPKCVLYFCKNFFFKKINNYFKKYFNILNKIKI